MVFIPATPQSKLKKAYEKEIEKTEIKVKVVERSGKTLKSMLQKSDPSDKLGCEDKERCMVCGTGGKGACRRENVTYEIKCKECDNVYIGETARNAYTRGLEHITNIKKKDNNSGIYKHFKQAHKNKDPQYTMTVTGTYRHALTRQITEAVKINSVVAENRLNNNEEWGRSRLPRASLTVE